jgi:hypothetical protein
MAMVRWSFNLAVGLSAILGPVSLASAQSVFNPMPVSPYSRPSLTPYLNLLRGGDPAANYYLGVRPEFERRYEQAWTNAAIQNLSTRPIYDKYVDDRLDIDVPIQQLPPTGHPAGFQIYNSYYNMPGTRGYLPYNPSAARQMPR